VVILSLALHRGFLLVLVQEELHLMAALAVQVIAT
jgi:hypothetical protein